MLTWLSPIFVHSGEFNNKRKKKTFSNRNSHRQIKFCHSTADELKRLQAKSEWRWKFYLNQQKKNLFDWSISYWALSLCLISMLHSTLNCKMLSPFLAFNFLQLCLTYLLLKFGSEFFCCYASCNLFLLHWNQHTRLREYCFPFNCSTWFLSDTKK